MRVAQLHELERPAQVASDSLLAMPASRKGSATPEPKRRIGYEPRRKLILQAALEVFAEVGYHAASVDEIAHRADVTKPVVYDHFESKSALHLALLERERDALLAHVRERLEAGAGGAPGVAAALDAFYAWVESHPYAWMMLFRESTGEPQVIEAHRRIQAEAHVAVVDLLFADSGLVDDELDAVTREAMAATIGGATHGIARWWFDHRELPREEVVAIVMDLLWVGLERVRAGKRWKPSSRAARR
jgi:AcrR family transcriptional regulator